MNSRRLPKSAKLTASLNYKILLINKSCKCFGTQYKETPSLSRMDDKKEASVLPEIMTSKENYRPFPF